MSREYFTAEFKQQAVKMVIEHSRPIAEVARELHVSSQSLTNWISAYRKEHMSQEQKQTEEENKKIRELEKENRELRMEVEFLGKAVAFFAKKHDQ
jgi:transposase